MTGRRHALDLVPGLRQLAEEQSYVVRRTQLAALGVSRHHLRHQLGADRWSLLDSQVVLLHTGTPTTLQQRWAAVLQCGFTAVLGGLSALAQGGLRGWERDQCHVLVPVGVRPASPARAVLHTTSSLGAHEIERSHGCPATVPARSTIDAARWARSAREASGIVLAAVQQGLATPDELTATLAGFRIVKQQKAITAAIEDAAGRHDSLAEADVARLVVRAGLTAPRPQVEVATPDGGRWFDLAVDLPDGRLLLLEVDGMHHVDPSVRLKDAAKDAAAIAAGHQVLRIPVLGLRASEATIIRQLTSIRSAAERRAQRPPGPS
jgi:hypothetical protein